MPITPVLRIIAVQRSKLVSMSTVFIMALVHMTGGDWRMDRFR
ncbi:MAG TPA: hypothetical protein VFB83_02915 [Propionibacteriaceae bacterium]|nr:hypothetical protein [Propionibacteriaceae bacterium]